MNYYNEIKKQLIDNEVYKRVKDYSKNRSDLDAYYKVGKLLVDAQGGKERAKYGNGLIKVYSKKLTMELGKGYTVSALKRMRQFYIIIENGATMSHQLMWSHYVEILKLNSINEINYYILQILNHNLSIRGLRNRIKNNEYERLDEETKNKLIVQKEDTKIKDFIKHPIIIKDKYDHKIISEKVLKQLILEDLPSFMQELGEGFCFVNSEYKIKIGERYNYIDILLYNIKYNCFVVVELKVTQLRKEHIGQIEVYMNYIDKNIKTINQDRTIGIIICKRDNHFVMEYCSDDRIFNTTYEVVFE